MSDTKDKGGNSGGRKPLTVQRKSSGTVQQSFSHGRSKQVVVETKKRRSVGPGGSSPAPDAPQKGTDSREAKLIATAKKLGITVEELKARQKALLERKQEEAARAKEVQKREADQERLRSEQQRKVQEAKEREEAEARRKAEEEARKAEEAAAKERADRDKKSRSKPAAAAKAQPGPVPDEPTNRGSGKRGKQQRDTRDRGGRDSSGGGRGRDDGSRRRGKLTIASALGDDADRQRSLASLKRAREKERERRTGDSDQREKVSVEVTLPETITLQELAGRMNERVGDVVKFMIQQGEMLRGIDIIDADTAELIAEEFGHTVKRVSEADVEIGLEGADDDPKDLKTAPANCHDHGPC